jgi:transposase
VVDVPAKLSARVRVFDVGNGRKTDATDAHAMVMAALRDRGALRELSTDDAYSSCGCWPTAAMSCPDPARRD